MNVCGNIYKTRRKVGVEKKALMEKAATQQNLIDYSSNRDRSSRPVEE
jgi:hypothetical protein